MTEPSNPIETVPYPCVRCGHSHEEHDGTTHAYESRAGTPMIPPSDPPVGKDSSFEELLQPLRALIAKRAEGEGEEMVAALSRYVAQQREEIDELKKSKRIGTNILSELTEALLQVASLQSEIERQREEAERVKVVFTDDLEYWTSRAKKADAEYDELELLKQQWEKGCEKAEADVASLRLELSEARERQLTAQDLGFILSGEFGPRTCPCSRCVALSKKIHEAMSRPLPTPTSDVK